MIGDSVDYDSEWKSNQIGIFNSISDQRRVVSPSLLLPDERSLDPRFGMSLSGESCITRRTGQFGHLDPLTGECSAGSSRCVSSNS